MVVSVRIGEIGVGGGGATLRTLLGSCVGVLLYDHRQKTAGLVHIQLPDSSGNSDPQDPQPERYADIGIPELLRRLQSVSNRPLRVVAYVAGGADMFATTRTLTVGRLNVVAVDAILRRLNIPVVSHQCGGTLARRFTFDIQSGTAKCDVLLQANPKG